MRALLPEIPFVTRLRNLWPLGCPRGGRSAETRLGCALRETRRGARALQPGLERPHKPLAAICVQMVRRGREDGYSEGFFTKKSCEAAGDRVGGGGNPSAPQSDKALSS